MLPETPYVLYMQLQHQVTHRNGAIKHILHESDPRRDHQQIVLYSFCRSMRLLFYLAVKILLQIFPVYEDLRMLALAGICRLYFLSRNSGRTALCYATNTIKWKTFLIFDINHQQKHKEVRPDWNDKNDNVNYAPSYHTEGFTNGSGCHF